MDNVLKEVGQCGRFQVCHVILVQLCRFVATWGQMIMVFGLYNPGWQCVQQNSTALPSLPGSEFPHSANATYGIGPNSGWNFSSLNDSSETYDVTADSDVGTCDVMDSCDDVEFYTTSSTIVTEFGLLCDRIWIAYIILSVRSAGMLLGALAWAQIGERFGRKVGLYGSTSVMAVSSGLAVFSPNWQVYAIFVFFVGFGAGAIVNVASVLCMEFLTSKWRARVSAIPTWNVGVLCCTLVIFLLRDWRHIHIATAVSCGLACLGFFWTPESLRWLVVHSKVSKAERVVDKMAKVNNRSAPKEALTELLKEVGERKDGSDKKYTYLDLFRTGKVRSLTLRIALIWAACLCVYDVIGFGMHALPGDFFTNILLASVVELPGPFIMGLLANKAGRRIAGMALAAFGVFCCSVIVVALLAADEGSGRDITVTSLAFGNRLVAQAILSLMLTYSAELTATTVRNLAFGFFAISARLVGVASPFIIPSGHTSMVVCFSFLLAIQAAVVTTFFSLAETRNRPLRDTDFG